MFRNWGFLLTEIWVLLLLAALLGLLVGWLIWARRAASCMVDLKAQRYAFKEKQARIASLEEELRRTKAGETGQLALDEVKIAAVDQSIENKGRETRSAEVLASELAALKASAVISERERLKVLVRAGPMISNRSRGLVRNLKGCFIHSGFITLIRSRPGARRKWLGLMPILRGSPGV